MTFLNVYLEMYLVNMFLIVFLRLEYTNFAYIFTVWMLVIVAESQRQPADFGHSELKGSYYALLRSLDYVFMAY